MLQNLSIRNIAIADNIDIDWRSGMTSISGETGAGKSILLNSLSLALGDRADSNVVRYGEKRAEVVAAFDISRIDAAKAWLKERDLDDGSECLLRRTVSNEGRSRAFINGQPVPLAELKVLGEHLIDIHSQHAHQSLLRHDTHLKLLDEYADNEKQLQKVKEAWIAWQGLDRKLNALSQSHEEREARRQLLEYQCQELEALELQEGEVETLEIEFQRIQQSETLLTQSHQARDILANESGENAAQAIKTALNCLQKINDRSEPLSNAISLLDSAVIQVEESAHDLDAYIDSIHVDEERSHYLESRLDTIHTLSRKHNINSDQLFEFSQSLQAEYSELNESQGSLEELQSEVAARKQTYLKQAKQLSSKRKTAANAFSKEVIEKLNQLAMPGAQFKVAFLEQNKASTSGIDTVEYQISLNPGQPLQPLAKVASGGELSRVSLAIQVICAEHSTIPTLVFDEVDVGISGATAEIVGHMLRQVGQRGQVICVTHLPQVAALGHNHCIVEKQHHAKNTTSTIKRLTDEHRIDEIARMLGGIDITAQTRAHAEEMLRTSARAH
ncbi:DNA repair protein RecN [Reinekea marina]|uniref:DNA repair protein RecN n=2 Tax=Reinekea marina TaxID=1310421 RepID=A0ABV7WLC3_9GAMM